MNGAFDNSLSGLIAQRQRTNTIADNIANATQDTDGNISLFQRRIVTFTADSENTDSEATPVSVKYRVELDTQTLSAKYTSQAINTPTRRAMCSTPTST